MPMVAASALLGTAILHWPAIVKALLLLVVAIVYLVQTLPWSQRKSTCTTPLPPGPPLPWPVVGKLPEMMLNKPAFRWIHRMMEDTDIACIKLGGVHIIPIKCPVIAGEVLRKHDAAFASRPLTFASETFSAGYRSAALSPNGDQWKKMRRVLASEIICPSRHSRLHDKRAEEADNLTGYVYKLVVEARSGDVDVRHVARHYCGNVIRRLVFNRRYFGEPQSDGGPGPLEVMLAFSA